MAFRLTARAAVGYALAASLSMAGALAVAGQDTAPLTLASGKVTIAGTSNIHAYTASTTAVRVTRLQFAKSVAAPNLWDAILTPGGVEHFEIAIPASSLASPNEGLDKNMHKALKVKEHADITFRLSRFETVSPGVLKAIGVLRIAGVERETTLDIKTERTSATLTVKGEVRLLMTDFGIAPPKAMLGMLKTDPKVTVSFETVLTVPLT